MENVGAAHRLGKLIMENLTQAVEEWRERVLTEQTRQPSERVPAPYLLDHVPPMLQRLAQFLEAYPSLTAAALNVDYGEGYGDTIARRDAGYHARDIVTEIAILRSVLYALIERNAVSASTQIHALLNAHIDALLFNVSGYFDDLRQSSEERAAEAVRRVSTLERVASAALQGTRIEAVFDAVLREIQLAFNADAVTFLLPAPGEAALQVRSSVGLPSDRLAGVRIPFGAGFAGKIFASGRPWCVADVRSLEMIDPRFASRISSVLGVPLRYESRVLGVLHVATVQARSFSEQDEVFLQLLSDRISVAVAHAELYEAESSARRRADEERQRMLTLYETSAELISVLDMRSMLRKVAERALVSLGDWCLIDLLENGRLHNTVGVHRDPAKNEWLSRIGEYASRHDPRAKVIRRRRAALVKKLDDATLHKMAIDEERYRALAELGTESLIVVPLLARGRALGTLSFGRGPGPPFNDDDLSLANEMGRQIGLAADNALLVEDLRSALRGREEILAVVSHDLRNPLSTILLSAEASQRLSFVEKSGTLLRHLQLIHRAGEAMDRLIADLLDFSRISEHRLPVDRHPECAVDILHEAVQLSSGVASTRDVDVVEDAAGLDGSLVEVDRGRVIQVLSNLIANAVRFSPPGGTVTISGKRVSLGVVVEVKDQGPGVAPEEAVHIFEPFWQGRQASREGTGLGLAIAKGIVEAHGGQIWIERGDGGAVFAFSLLSPTVH